MRTLPQDIVRLNHPHPNPLPEGEGARGEDRGLSLRLLQLWCVVLALLLLPLGGCKKNDMYEQPKYRAYEPSALFPDRASARPLVEGTVPREEFAANPAALARAVVASQSTYVPPAEVIPFPVTRGVIDRGHQRYDIYCAVCHGRLGNGNGMIVQRGFPAPASYHIRRLREAPDSYYYNVISNGRGAMYSYNDRVIPADRWNIIAYIRALQAGSAALPPQQQAALQGTRQ